MGRRVPRLLCPQAATAILDAAAWARVTRRAPAAASVRRRGEPGRLRFGRREAAVNPATSASAAGDLNRAGCARHLDARAFGLRVRRSRVGRAACGAATPPSGAGEGSAPGVRAGRPAVRRARPQRLAGIREVPIPEAPAAASGQAEVSLEALLLSPFSTPKHLQELLQITLFKFHLASHLTSYLAIQRMANPTVSPSIPFSIHPSAA